MLRPSILACCVLCLFQGCQLVSGNICNTRSQYWKLDKCCSKCPPGTYMSSECTETKDSECQRCDSDRYQSEWNTLDHCQLHKSCNPNGGFVVEKPGTTTSDTICQCQLGMYCINTDCEICEENKVCGPGYGVVYKEDRGLSRPVCERCEPGYFSNVSSNMEPCRKWSDCGSLQMLENGTATKDMKCGILEPPSKVGLITVIVFLSVLLAIIILLSFICIGSNKEHRTKIRDIINRLCPGNMRKPVQEHVKTENGRILATAGDEDNSPEDGTELLPV
ncbi:tumor necrosis factor receptor superfamily member 5-like [Hemiscyllium ocellatum]|uniref:tumor necrosis factor receptor superfamily member 5-like n=1 Tax=Hemiscyllium ocellatum TaxID=170820 RepID=UPI002967015C|nr:tumor necrosis factor receptor superfamily member 5-like [Hemiscyllium ocellatum]